MLDPGAGTGVGCHHGDQSELRGVVQVEPEIAGAHLLGQRCEHGPQDQVTGEAGTENGEVLLVERELELADVMATVGSMPMMSWS